MRKEVKLGMAIGGGLLAVLVVYLLVTPPNKNKTGAQLAGGSIIDTSQSGDSTAGAADDKSGGAKASADLAASVQAANTSDASAAHDQVIAKPDQTGAVASAEQTGTSGDDWKKLLQTGKVGKSATEKTTALAKERPAKERDAVATKSPAKHDAPAAAKHDAVAQATPAGAAEQGNLYYDPNAAWGGGISTGAVFGTAAHSAKTASAARATRDASSSSDAAAAPAKPGATTHVVQSGDTLSSIAAEVYGSANYYPHILRANPQVNPNSLKLGTVLNLPHVDEVKANTAAPAEHANGVVASIAPDIKIDSTRQYQVQSGDSLYKISLKLYGKSTYVERIYEKNKAAIGSDPKKLKLGMILDLPEKTTVAAASAASESNGEEDRR